ncbi:DUF4192 domain-containing protein, partial [Mycobacterium simiae]|uniref:DUF4192 domain-containing protein n=1 Tax=Mycobacterium simiae TaxID=1784 RepID=UPI0021CD3D59
PGLLGFAPTDSIVAIMLRDDPTHGLHVRCAIRFDVTVTTEEAAHFPATCSLRAADNAAAVLIAVCDQRHDGHARDLLNALRDALHTAGIRVLRRLYARDATEPGQWLDADTGDYGDTYPYTDSVLTAQLVHTGERVRASRAELEAEFGPLPPAPPVEVGDHGELVTSTARDIADAIAGAPTTSPTLATRAGIVITAHPALRDAMLCLAIDNPHAGADLWTHLGRRLRGRHRTEALTVAAACLVLARETVRAGIALDAALDEAEATHTPTPRLAVMLSTALRAGIPPSTLRHTLLDGLDRTAQPDPAPPAD